MTVEIACRYKVVSKYYEGIVEMSRCISSPTPRSPPLPFQYMKEKK